MGNAFIVKPLPIGTVTAEGSAAGTLPGYLDNDHIGVVHRGTSTSAAWVQCDLGAAQGIDTAAFLSANALGAQTLQVRADDDSTVSTGPTYDSTALAFAAGSALPGSGRQNSLWAHTSVITERYWRFDIASLGGTAFDAGRLVMGRRIDLARQFAFGAAWGVKDLGRFDLSPNGVIALRKSRKLSTIGLSFPMTHRDEAEDKIVPLFESIGNTAPILLVTNGEADAQRSRRMFFGYLVGDLSAVWNTADGWEWRANLVSIL